MAPTADKDTFNFFGLPRELRDLVYHELCTYRGADLLNRDDVKVYRKHQPPATALLISHQFSEECLSSSLTAGMLVLEDRLEMLSVPRPLSILPGLAKLRSIHFDIYAPCAVIHRGVPCSVGQELSGHHVWIARIIQQAPSLQVLEIHVHLSTNSEAGGCCQRATQQLSRLARLPHVVELEVYYVNFHKLSRSEWDYGAPKKQAARWCSQSRQMVEVEPLVTPESEGGDEE